MSGITSLLCLDPINIRAMRPLAAMSIRFFDFPLEIRLQIYVELLAVSEPITFIVSRYSYGSPFAIKKRYGLCPALLLTDKRVHRECRQLLYSSNCFNFSNLRSTMSQTEALSWFLSNIGHHNASFVRRICIQVLAFGSGPSLVGNASPQLHRGNLKTLEPIRDNCICITTLEILLQDAFHWKRECHNLELDRIPVAANALDLLDACVKAISSLKLVIIGTTRSYNASPSDDLRKKLIDFGWTPKLTRNTNPEVSLRCRGEVESEG